MSLTEYVYHKRKGQMSKVKIWGIFLISLTFVLFYQNCAKKQNSQLSENANHVNTNDNEVPGESDIAKNECEYITITKLLDLYLRVKTTHNGVELTFPLDQAFPSFQFPYDSHYDPSKYDLDNIDLEFKYTFDKSGNLVHANTTLNLISPLLHNPESKTRWFISNIYNTTGRYDFNKNSFEININRYYPQQEVQLSGY